MNTNICSHICKISKYTRFPGSGGSESARKIITDFLYNIGKTYEYSEMPNWSLTETSQVEVIHSSIVN